MEKKMFCFQCEQTAGCNGCAGMAGVCGKKADTAMLQDRLTGELIGLARAVGANETLVSDMTSKIVIESLFSTLTNVNFHNKTLSELIDKVQEEKEKLLAGQEADGENDAYEMKNLWEAEEDIRSLKSLILFGIRGIAAYAYHALVLGYRDSEVDHFLYKALRAVGMDDWGME